MPAGNNVAPGRNPFLVSSGSSAFGGGLLTFNHGSISGNSGLQKYLRRVQSGVDIEYLAYQFVYATLAPSKVYKLTTLRKQTKNQWARDEPSFVLLLLAFIAASTASWAVAYGVSLSSPLTIAWAIGLSWLQFLVTGVVISTVCWAVANRALRSPAPLPYSTVTTEVDWGYAWDLHCNGSTMLFWTANVLQLLAAPLVLGEGWLATICNNVLHGVGWVGYWYVVYLGYATLPFVRRPNLFLAPAAVAVAVLLVLTALNINVGRLMLGTFIE